MFKTKVVSPLKGLNQFLTANYWPLSVQCVLHCNMVPLFISVRLKYQNGLHILRVKSG